MIKHIPSIYKDFLNTEETDEKLIAEDVFNFSFDGSFLYINDLSKGEEFLKHIKKHLKRHLKDLKEEEHNYDFEDDGFSNAFFYSYNIGSSCHFPVVLLKFCFKHIW